MTENTIFGVSTAWILASAWSAVVAIIVLGAGWLVARIVSRAVSIFIATRVKDSAIIAPLVGQVVRYAILVVAVVVVLGQFGVQTASILAVLGAAGLAIALALQGTLSNIAAGIMILFLRPFDEGDFIDADGITGTVVEVGLFATQMRTIDGVFLLAPNSKLSNAKIINYSREKDRIVEVKFNVPRSADLGFVRSQLIGAMRTDYSDPKAKSEVLLDTLGDSSLTLMARVPVRSRDWWRARSEVQERIKQVLDANNNFAAPPPASAGDTAKRSVAEAETAGA